MRAGPHMLLSPMLLSPSVMQTKTTWPFKVKRRGQKVREGATRGDSRSRRDIRIQSWRTGGMREESIKIHWHPCSVSSRATLSPPCHTNSRIVGVTRARLVNEARASGKSLHQGKREKMRKIRRDAVSEEGGGGRRTARGGVCGHLRAGVSGLVRVGVRVR